MSIFASETAHSTPRGQFQSRFSSERGHPARLARPTSALASDSHRKRRASPLFRATPCDVPAPTEKRPQTADSPPEQSAPSAARPPPPHPRWAVSRGSCSVRWPASSTGATSSMAATDQQPHNDSVLCQRSPARCHLLPPGLRSSSSARRVRAASPPHRLHSGAACLERTSIRRFPPVINYFSH